MAIMKFRFAVAYLFLIFASPVFAVEPPVPQEYVGDWVPLELSCEATMRLRIEPASVSLISGADSQTFDDLDICHSCAGGSKYGGVMVWLLPEFSKGKSPLIVRLNHNEEQGVTVVEMRNGELAERFPLHDR